MWNENLFLNSGNLVSGISVDEVIIQHNIIVEQPKHYFPGTND